MARRAAPARKARAAKSPGARTGPGAKGAPAASFPIVGVGASAGGLEAFRQLLAHVPAGSGLAFVLVQHLEATKPSLLSEALAQATTMKVAQAEQGERVEPNRVYVIPPGVQLAIVEGALRLSPPEVDARRPLLPIDHFLRSLAAERGAQAIGVILSGSASDGTAGLAAIRAQGGITFAQDPRSARFGEMPRSAIDAGVVDFCLPLPALGAELARLARHPYLAHAEPVAPTPAGAAVLAKVVALVRVASGVDFAEYKPETLRRRLARRIAVRLSKDVAAYLEVLRSDPAEVRALYEDLLIHVTSFFRDEEAFDELKGGAYPGILRHKPAGAPIRAWVVGCSTGEEVYSLAISLVEHLGDGLASHPVLIFGSDLSEKAIAVARLGLYPDAAVRGLSAERLQRFFVREERGWRIRPAIRELCVFVRHDVARDPPFSRLDLVSCRNVLIYFGQPLQRRVLELLHYGLNQPGYLFLGRSESAAGVPRWFAATSKDGRIFQRRPGASTYRFAPHPGAPPAPRPPAAHEHPQPLTAVGVMARQANELVLARYGPPGVVVNERLEVVQFRGQTGPYLEQPQGEPQSNVLKMARRGLASPLRIALALARKSEAPVRTQAVAVDGGSSSRRCDLVVLPFPAIAGSERTFVVLFEELSPAVPAERGERLPRRNTAARRALEEELASTKEHLGVLLEEHGRANDALASANDELVSGNEELQSLNEELETAKEELQATNEELTTLNDELHARNQELQRVNTDVLNLLDAVELPILMLDPERRIRRLTRCASTFLGLSPADLGKRISDVNIPIQVPDLEQWIARSMEAATLVEVQIQDRSGRWHRLQVRPRRGADGHPDGTILSLVDIDELRHEVVLAQLGRDYARSIVEAVQVPLVVLDAELHVISANAAYYRLGHGKPAETEGLGFFNIGAGAWNLPELRRAVGGVLPAGRFQAVELERVIPGAGRRAISVSGCAVPSLDNQPMILLALEDVTDRRRETLHRIDQLEIAKGGQLRAEQAHDAKDRFLANLSHELRTPLTTILLNAELLQRDHLDAGAVSRAAAAIEANTRRQVRLVEDLLDVTRVASGKLGLAKEELDWRALVRGAVEAERPGAAARSVRLEADVEGESLRCLGDPVRLQQVVSILLTNAVKFTPGGGRINVRVDAVDGSARLVVSDTGRGIESAFLPRLFQRFMQEGSGGHTPGLGLGLAIARDLVAQHGGTIQAESPGRDLGATFTVMLPRQASSGAAAG